MRRFNVDVFCICLVVACFAGLIHAKKSEADSVDIETKVKAAYLSKFVSYVEWPASVFAKPDAPVMIGVINADEIAAELTGLKTNRSANSRAFDVKILKAGEPLSGVQLVFIGKGEGDRLKRLLSSVQSRPVLTVTESPGAISMGSMINFILVNERIRFEVSTVAAESSNIKISARLLDVAKNVVAKNVVEKNPAQKNESGDP